VEVVEETCERLWAAVERAHAEEALRESEARWRGLFERMHEGFALYEMVYDAEGRAVDFRHLEVNAACERLTGLPASAIVGRLASEAVPGIERFWTDTYARVAETGEPVHFEHRVAALDRWFEVLAHRDGAGRVAVLFLNVTERKAAEARRDALVELGDRLRDLTEPAEIAHAAAEIIGRTLGGTRAACGIVDAARGGLPHRAGLDGREDAKHRGRVADRGLLGRLGRRARAGRGGRRGRRGAGPPDGGARGRPQRHGHQAFSTRRW
jgi:PAS domain S-box-containing protein